MFGLADNGMEMMWVVGVDKNSQPGGIPCAPVDNENIIITTALANDKMEVFIE